MKQAKIEVGLLINFNMEVLKKGIRRVILCFLSVTSVFAVVKELKVICWFIVLPIMLIDDMINL